MRSHANRPVSSAKNIPKKRAVTAARSFETEKSSPSGHKRKTNIDNLQRRQTIIVELLADVHSPASWPAKSLLGT